MEAVGFIHFAQCLAVLQFLWICKEPPASYCLCCYATVCRTSRPKDGNEEPLIIVLVFDINLVANVGTNFRSFEVPNQF